MIDITDRYTWDSGQTDSYYDHGSITLMPGAQPPTGQTAVLFNYYTHSGTGYLSSTSYDNSIYSTEKIPVYRSSSGIEYNLRDCIDLRPIRASGLSATPYAYANANARVNVTSGGVVVSANTSLTSNVLSPPITTGTIIRVGADTRTVNTVTGLNTVTVDTPFTAAVTNGTIEIVTQNMSYSGGLIQRPTDSMQIDYEYYLPRIDKVIATKDKEFKILSGIPALTPKEPDTIADAMAIYTLYIPPYTATLDSIELNFIDNRRYTMKDISELDNRIYKIEKYLSIKDSETKVIQDPPGNRPIYGTIVDEFNDLTVVDQNIDFAASIENGVLCCYRFTSPFTMKPANSTYVRDKFVTLPFTETTFAAQKLATSDGGQIVTSMIAKYDGFVTLSPESDYFYSVEHKPLNSTVQQNSGTTDAALTTTVLTTIGANNYLTVDQQQLAGHFLRSGSTTTYEVVVPAYSVTPTTTEPTSTMKVPINQVGVTPVTSLQISKGFSTADIDFIP